jgi:hypothetical protein
MDPVLRFLCLVASGLFLVACHMAPAQVGGLLRGGISLACTAAVRFVPPTATDITAEVCKDAAILEPDLEAVIVDALAETSAPNLGPARLASARGAASSTPASSATAAPVALTCAGRAVIALSAPPPVTARAQARLDARPECAR